ncbi:MAG: malto-oligosyltrehalose synthase [Phycicoccus sp.]|nr:malto-oligosyltrehalose synthase [Phycicoccus sp.]
MTANGSRRHLDGEVLVEPSPAHRPGPGRPVPVSTYRLQLHAGFTLTDAAQRAGYFADLGVTHLYLSPILQSVPGSGHGYDVLDHTRIDADRGGREGLDLLVSAAREHGLGLIVDVVPNHMAVPAALHQNAPLWSLLREGRESPWAAWFDVDWVQEDDRILMPLLGSPLNQALSAGEITLDLAGGPTGAEPVIRYWDTELPVRPGTQDLPLKDLLDAQVYRLSSWREAGEGLNYRRFFDVTSLVGIRVEDPVVFTATHALLVALLAHGEIDGLRIDHPDGLADPAGYLRILAEATGDAWVVVEKILEGAEALPDAWRTAGTSGYDALLAVQQVVTAPGAESILDCLWVDHAPERALLAPVMRQSKTLVVQDVQASEIDRLLRIARRVLPDEEPRVLRAGIEALVVALDRYRTYFTPGGVQEGQEEDYAVLAEAEATALALSPPADALGIQLVAQLARGGRLPQAPIDTREDQDEFRIRFQQTTGPVMAKGVEDTAFYRWLRLSGANEVGGDPGTLSRTAAEFHAYATARQAHWPLAMTTLTTHDTKRSEDVRARLMTLASNPTGWDRWVRAASRAGQAHRSALVDAATEYLVWQTLVGTWPISPDRIEAYVLKAVREAKLHTAWVDGNAGYESAVVGFARAVVQDLGVTAHIESWLTEHTEPIRSNVLSQKLIQLTMPGVPDVYQGAEGLVLTLVDPDNRAEVDYDTLQARLGGLDAGATPVELDDEKRRLVAAVLRLRREHPHWFVGEAATYVPIETSHEAVLAFGRGDDSGIGAITVATLHGHSAADLAAQTVALPPGRWRNLLTGAAITGGEDRCVELAGDGPVALLVRAAE